MQNLTPAILTSLLAMLLLGVFTGCTGSNTYFVRVTTYNIHHGAGMDGKLDLNRIAKAVMAPYPIRGYFPTGPGRIWCFQEIENKTSRTGKVDQTAELAKLLSPGGKGMPSVFGKAIDYDGGGYGNAIVSWRKILSSRTVALPNPKGGEARCTLVAMYKNLVVISTHLCNKHVENRLASVKAINELPEVKAGKLPVILAGDFNATPDSPTIKALEAAGWRWTRPAEMASAPADKPTTLIDYIFVRGDGIRVLESKVISAPVASDHRPVWGNIRVTQIPSMKKQGKSGE